MKKIAIFQYDLGVGGIQKSLINLLSNIDSNKYMIDLYLFSDEIFFDISDFKNINIIKMKGMKSLSKLIPFKLLYCFYKCQITKSYDLSIDFNGYSNECALNALKVKSKKRIIWVHNDVIKKYENESKYKLLWNLFKSKYYKFDNVVAVSTGAKDSFVKKTKIKNNVVHVIPNIIDANEIILKSKGKCDLVPDKDYYNLVTVGRLCHQKGFDILIDYMKEVVKLRPKTRLYIIGDGPDYSKLHKKIIDSNLDKNLFLLGSKKNPYKYMKQLDGFVLTSRYEGQGMVILEAKILGLKIFITKNLEAYVEDVRGSKNIVDDIVSAKRSTKKEDLLTSYNKSIIKKIYNIFDGR